MKKVILATAILALTSAACQQNTVTNANAAKSNQAVLINSNQTTNANLMSNMATNGGDMSSMNGNGMNHDSMMTSSPNAKNAPYDLQFIDTMSVHHQSAVDMAKMVNGKTKNVELLKFAASIISDQTNEINQMKTWREKWFSERTTAVNMEMSGMSDSMKMMGDDMKTLEKARDKNFDLKFLEMMIPHHQSAVEMSKEALQRAEHPEIKSLANQIITAQETEIKMMNDWKNKWSK